VSRHRHRIAAELASTYHDVELFVPALVDFSYTTNDTPASDIGEQIAIHSLVAKLSVVGGIPGGRKTRFHPMVGFCPYREVKTSELDTWDVDAGRPNRYVPYADPQTAEEQDRYTPDLPFVLERARALHVPAGPWETARLRLPANSRSIDLVRHAIELGGFAGVKVYPPSGFLPLDNVSRFGERVGQQLDAAIRALYSYCEAMQVPILTHAAHSIGFAKDYDDFASPTAWARVLADYPELRLSFGHFGHLQGISDGTPGPDSWIRRFLDLIDRYPHVYADVGNSRLVFDAAYRKEYLAVLSALFGDSSASSEVVTKRRRRLLFGSDFWLNTIGPAHRESLTLFRDGISSSLGEQTRDWFLGVNALRFLGISDDNDQPDLDNLNRRRLVAFYDSQPLPSWLAATAAI
jgi:predicted TIM-barrel fold metal-dependent hydrolase